MAAPLPMVDVDTDMIIPEQFLKTIKRTGVGAAPTPSSRSIWRNGEIRPPDPRCLTFDIDPFRKQRRTMAISGLDRVQSGNRSMTEQHSDLVLREEKDGCCTLTLNRPQKLAQR